MEETNGSPEMGKERQSSESKTTFDDAQMKEMMQQGKRQKDDAMESQFPKRVRFNVQGEIFEVTKSTLELCRDTVIGRAAAKSWSGGMSEEIFIDRDKTRFRYVLDYIRDGHVNLPMTESREGFLKELEYYNFYEIEENAIVVGTVAEAGRMIGAIASNVHDEVRDIDNSIRDWEKKIQKAILRKKALKIAHGLYLRSQDDNLGKGGITLRVGEINDLKSVRDLANDNYGSYASEILAEHLQRYGLELVSLIFEKRQNKYSSDYCDITLTRKALPEEKFKKDGTPRK